MSTPLRELRTWRRVHLSLVREKSPEPYAQPAVVRHGGDVARLVRQVIRDDPREHFVAVYLDTAHRPIAVHVASIGTVNTTVAQPREVFGPALTLAATALVVAHNHPTGDPKPSPEDFRVTDRLRQAGDLLGVELLDHIVLGADAYHSIGSGTTHPLGS